MKHTIKTLLLTSTLLVNSLIIALGLSSVAVAEEKAVWIDVRTQAEYEQGHIKGAHLIPYDEIAQQIALAVPQKNQSINLYCHSGRRASIAKKTLEKLGYMHVQNYGSYQKLKQQGY